MSRIRLLISRITTFAVLILLFTTALGGVIGSPMGVSYVETDSMEPTLQPNDGFILIPDELTGPAEAGDVIIFRAKEVGDGGLTTHRVVDETERGYITQGDNNNATDQATDEPPVQPPQIVGQPLHIRGQILVLPQIGSVITTAASIASTAYSTIILSLGVPDISSTQFSFAICGLLIIIYAFESLRESNSHRENPRSRNRRRSREDGDLYSLHTILLGLTVIIILGTTAAMVIPSGPQQYGVIAGEGASNSPNIAPLDEQIELSHGLGNSPVLPMVVFLQGSDSVDITQQKVELQRGELTNISATISTPSSIGYYRFYVTEYWYLPILPAEVLTPLYLIHPWLPIVVIDVIIAVPYYWLGRHMLSRHLARSRSRSRDRSS